MSRLGSLYIERGEPDGELAGCFETAEWAAGEIERLDAEIASMREQIEAVDALIEQAALAERKACARICELVWADTPENEPNAGLKPHPAFACALQIRARSGR